MLRLVSKPACSSQMMDNDGGKRLVMQEPGLSETKSRGIVTQPLGHTVTRNLFNGMGHGRCFRNDIKTEVNHSLHMVCAMEIKAKKICISDEPWTRKEIVQLTFMFSRASEMMLFWAMKYVRLESGRFISAVGLSQKRLH